MEETLFGLTISYFLHCVNKHQQTQIDRQ